MKIFLTTFSHFMFWSAAVALVWFGGAALFVKSIYPFLP